MHGKRKLINMGEKDANSILLGIPEIKKYEKNFPRPKEWRSPSARTGVGGQAWVGLGRLSPERLGKWMDSWNACPEVCLEPVGKVNSLRLAWGTQQVVAKGWMGPKGKFGNGWSLEQRPVDAHWEAGVGEESEHVNDQEGMSGWSHPSVVLGSDPGLGLAGKKPQSYGQAFAFMLASFCSSLLTLQPRLALLPYYQASVCVTMPGSPCLDHRAWITVSGSPCPESPSLEWASLFLFCLNFFSR